MTTATAPIAAGATNPGAASVLPTAPTITLKKFTKNERLSDETLCYFAEVWVNGRPAFTAENHGQGAADDFRPIYPRGCSAQDAGFKAAQAAYARAMALLEAYAATLPPTESELKNPDGSIFTMKQDVESLIHAEIERAGETKRRARFEKKLQTVVFLTDAKGLRTFRMRDGLNVTPEVIAKIKASNPGARTLNEMPPADAWAIARKFEI